jgi:D-alanine transaminase
MIVFLNGAFVAEADATVSIRDRAFVFGDAVYEALRARGGRYFEPDRHLHRLRYGLDQLRMTVSEAEVARLLPTGEELLRRNDLLAADALVYIQVSRGVAPRRHAFPDPDVGRTVLVTTTPFTAHQRLAEHGATAVTSEDVRWSRCDIKTVNLLGNVLANQQAVERGAYEAILVREGFVTEASHSNVFAVIGGTIWTHPADRRILRGVTRDVVIACAVSRGWTVQERPFTARELLTASEVFLTGTTTDVMPIVVVDNAQIGDGRPGRVTRALADNLARRVAAL